VQSGSAFNSITIKNSAGTQVTLLSKKISGNTLTLTRSGSYVNGAKYTINLPTNCVTDLAGNGLATAFSSSFTVKTA